VYVDPNFKTKKAFKDAVASNKPMQFYQPGLGPPAPDNGTITVSGPHYPEPHRWYAQVTLKDGKPIKVS
jgi:hypothetical protein